MMTTLHYVITILGLVLSGHIAKSELLNPGNWLSHIPLLTPGGPMSDSEASQVSLSSQSQRFVPQEDDEETLWEVIEIMAEKGDSYKVKWKGNDPKTMKPWPQSWVHRTDCTDDLVMEWRHKQKAKKAGRKFVKGRRTSTVSRKSGRDSASTVGASTSRQPIASGSKTTRRPTSPTTTTVTSKSTRRSTLVPTIIKEEPRKSSVAQHTDDDKSEPSRSKAKGKKRKLENPTSANSSANHAPRHTSVDVNVDQEGKAIRKKPNGRPRKKRKIQVEVTKMEPELEDEDIDNPARSNHQLDQEESYEIRKANGKIASPEEEEVEEEEERMVEDVLSQASPPQVLENDENDIYVQNERSLSPEIMLKPSKNKGKRKEQPLFLPDEDSTPPVKIGPPIDKRLSSRAQSSNNKSNKLPRMAVSNADLSDSPSASKQHSSGRRTESRMPTEERSVFWDGNANELQYPTHKPELSPAALERLAQFDEEVMGITWNPSTSAPTVLPRPQPVSMEPVSTKPFSKEPTETTGAPIAQIETTNGRGRSISTSKNSKEVDVSQYDVDRLSKVKQPPATKNSLPRTTKPSSRSYDTEIIPETDASQSQEPKEATQPILTTALAPNPQMTSHSSPSEKNRPPKIQKLRPIPALSPSVFHAHLPVPSSLLPEDISEDPSQEQRRAYKPGKKVKAAGASDEDPPMSSIEQFESPEKKQMKPVVVVPPPASRGKQSESASDIWESDIVRRGQVLAEAAKQRNRGSRGGTLNVLPKKSLEEVIAKTRARNNSALTVTDSKSLAASAPPPIPEADEEDMGGASTDVVPSASEPQATMNGEGQAFLEMERAYADLSGGTDETSMEHDGGQALDPMLLRQEEEESTQDLMAEMQAHQSHDHMDGIIEGELLVQGAVANDDAQDSAEPPAEDSVDKVIPEIVVASPAPALENRPVPRLTRSRSKSQTPLPQPPSRSSSRTNGKASKTTNNGKSIVAPPPIPTIPEITEIDTGAAHDMALAFAELQTELAAERVKNAMLMKESANVMEDMRLTADQSADLNKKLKADHDAEKLSWEEEKLRLTVQLDLAQKAEASADKDRDFFREQYAKASGFVSSIRDENKDLEKRVKIAEEQTKTGVGLIKATYELRCKTLEDDLKSWRKMAEFLIEKDRRSDSDELRRRAAEEPELRALCQRQAAAYAKAQECIFTLEAELEERRRECLDLETNYNVLKSETTRLTVDLNEASTKLERIGRADEYGNASLDETENGHEFVYRCKWHAEQNEPCRAVFFTISELEQHLLGPGGHLHC